MLGTLYPLKITPLLGYWDTDHDRTRTRNTRPSNAQCTNICISKPPTFSLRTSILLIASVILAPNRKYTERHFGQKKTVAPLCEWINRRAKRLNRPYSRRGHDGQKARLGWQIYRKFARQYVNRDITSLLLNVPVT